MDKAYSTSRMSGTILRGSVPSVISVFLAGQAVAAPINLNFYSDGFFRSSDTEQVGWQEIGFDDSSWDSARYPYPNPNNPQDVIPGTRGNFIWHDPTNSSDGTYGSTLAFFRRDFVLDVDVGSLPLRGRATIAVDDFYEFYVNGVLVSENKDSSNPASIHSFTFSESVLRDGVNVFAIKAQDGYTWGDPEDRLYESVLLDGTISTVPLPGGLALLLPSILGLGALSKRRRGAR